MVATKTFCLSFSKFIRFSVQVECPISDTDDSFEAKNM